jgi:hypothetical protein
MPTLADPVRRVGGGWEPSGGQGSQVQAKISGKPLSRILPTDEFGGVGESHCHAVI